MESENIDFAAIEPTQLATLTEADWLWSLERCRASLEEAWPLAQSNLRDACFRQQESESMMTAFPTRRPGAADLATICLGLAEQVHQQIQQEFDWELDEERFAEESVVQFEMRVEFFLRTAVLLGAMDFSASHRDLVHRSVAGFESAVKSWFDGDGLPDAGLAAQFEPLILSVARCYFIFQALGQKIDSELESQLEWIVRQALRSLKPGGGVLLSNQRPKTRRANLDLILAMSSDPADTWIAAQQFRHVEAPLGDFDVDPSACSEWGRTAFLQTGWDRKATKLGVDFSEGCRIDLFRKVPLLVGEAMPQVFLDGNPLSIESEPEVCCWHSDEDADLLELEIEFSEGVVLQRQFVLAREDEFLFVGDAVCHHEPDSMLGLRVELNAADGIQMTEEAETNEVYLVNEKILGLVVPVSLGEWKADKSLGTIKCHRNRVVIDRQAKGQNLYSGLFLDLKPKRAVKPRTWRQLTVGENLTKCSDDQAVAYRVQVGKSQWVIYRSLASPANRTFFGENHLDEFFVGRFDREGMTPLVKIQ